MALYLFVTVEPVGVGDDIIIRYYSLFIYTHLFHYVAQNSYNACRSILAAYHMAFGGFHRSGTEENPTNVSKKIWLFLHSRIIWPTFAFLQL